MANMTTSGLTVLFKAEKDHKEDKYAEALTDLGLQCFVIPVSTTGLCNLNELTECLRKPDNYSGIVFTSSRAVEGTIRALPPLVEWTPLHEKWRDTTVYVVGEATAEAVESGLNFCTIGKECGNAEALSRLIIKMAEPTTDNKPLLFPCGQLRKETLYKNLSEATPSPIPVQEIVIYQTEPHPDIETNVETVLQAGIPEYVIYFSPSGVKYTEPIFKELGFPCDNTKFVAIGPSTKAALVEAGMSVHCMASHPTAMDLVDAIRDRHSLQDDFIDIIE